MKPILRLALSALTGLVLGWSFQHFRQPPPPDSTAARQTAPLPKPEKPPRPDWQRWLESSAPLHFIPDPAAFWSWMPQAGKVPQTEWKLALDEAFFAIPPDVFCAVLVDERFARFPRLYEVEYPAAWSRKLLGLGLEKALAMAGHMPTSWLNDHLENRLLGALAKEDPERGFAWLKESGRVTMQGEYLGKVASHNEDRTAALFGKLDASERYYASYMILKALSKKDWSKAAAWGKENLTPAEWSASAGRVFDGYTGRRLAELREIGDTISDPALRSAAYSRWLVTAASGQEVLDKALNLPAGSLTSEGWEEAGGTCGSREISNPDPVAAARKLLELTSKVREQDRAAFQKGAIRAAVYNNGPLAAQFYDLMEPASAALASTNWTQKDPVAVSAWLATLEPSVKKEAAVVAFCREATSIDPAGAAEWALSLTDASQRGPALRAALTAWGQSDSTAAEAWAAKNGVGK